MSKYPYIGKSIRGGHDVLFYGSDLSVCISMESTRYYTGRDEGFYKNITAEYLRNTKIKIESPKHSEFVQRLVLGAGGEWFSGDKNVKFKDKKHLFITNNLMITICLHDESFNDSPKKEIFLPLPPKEPERNDLDVKAKNLSQAVKAFSVTADKAIKNIAESFSRFENKEDEEMEGKDEFKFTLKSVNPESEFLKIFSDGLERGQNLIIESVDVRENCLDQIPISLDEKITSRGSSYEIIVNGRFDVDGKKEEEHEEKPIYTREMHERGELPPVGSEVIVSTGSKHSIVVASEPDDNGMIVTKFDGEYLITCIDVVKPIPQPIYEVKEHKKEWPQVGDKFQHKESKKIGDILALQGNYSWIIYPCMRPITIDIEDIQKPPSPVDELESSLIKFAETKSDGTWRCIAEAVINGDIDLSKYIKGDK